MPRYHVLAAAASLAALAGCNHVEGSYRYAEGVTAEAKPLNAPVEILAGRPTRAFRSLGTVEVRVDRGTALKNPTLSDAIPGLSAQARAMGADAVMLTHEQFASWYDKGEGASPIHDLERQETWYITEKGRYVTGVAIAYSGCAAPSYPTQPPPAALPPAPSRTPLPPAPPPSPLPPPPPGPIEPMPPPPPPPTPVPAPTDGPGVPVAPTAPSLPEGPIELPPSPENPRMPELPPLPETPKAPEAPPLPETPKAPELPPLPETPKAPELPPLPETPKAPEQPK